MATDTGQNPTNTDTPLWNKLVAAATAIAFIAAIVIFRHRIGADFWPLDASRVGPNIVASILIWAAIFTASVLLYPPWRRRLHRFVDNKLLPVHQKLNDHKVSLDDLHRKHDELHDTHKALLKAHQDLLESHAAINRKLDKLASAQQSSDPPSDG